MNIDYLLGSEIKHYINLTKFQNRLKKQRINKQLSQAQLAKALNVSQRSISSWETGFRQPNLETLILIAIFFDVTTDYLLGLEN